MLSPTKIIELEKFMKRKKKLNIIHSIKKGGEEAEVRDLNHGEGSGRVLLMHSQ